MMFETKIWERNEQLLHTKGKQAETKIWKKQYVRTTLSRIKAWKGLMGHHIKHANGRRQRKHNGK
jgi:hypothetical protein